MRNLDVTVAICTYGRYNGAVRALESIASQATSNVVVQQIIVVDNAPDYASAARATFIDTAASFPRVRIIVEPQLGVSHARNRALYSCTSPLIAYLDDDCRASPQWLNALVSTYLSAGAGVGGVGGRVEGEWSVPPPPWLSAPLLQYLSLLDWGPARLPVLPPRYLLGGNVLYPVDDVKRVGGFRCYLGRIGDTLLSNEEVDLCDRLVYCGARLIYEPAALVTHVIDPSRLTVQWFRRRVFWQAISDVLLDSTRPSGSESRTKRLRISDSDNNTLWNELKTLYNATLRYASIGADDGATNDGVFP